MKNNLNLQDLAKKINGWFGDDVKIYDLENCEEKEIFRRKKGIQC